MPGDLFAHKTARQARLYGFASPQELEGLYAPLLFDEKDRDRAFRYMKGLSEDDKPFERICTALRRDGSEFLVELTGINLPGSDQDVQGYLCLTRDITDSGTGIDRVKKDNVFKPFFTTKKDGLGMGLPIYQSIIEEHGERIWGENNPTGGTTFSFSSKAGAGELAGVPEKG